MWNISTVLSSMILKDARLTREMKSTIAIEKAAFKKEQTLSTANWTYTYERNK
jgi:hypothetical protein